jgi:hypothetical protein
MPTWNDWDGPDRELSQVPPGMPEGPYCKMTPCPLIEPSWGPCEQCATQEKTP